MFQVVTLTAGLTELTLSIFVPLAVVAKANTPPCFLSLLAHKHDTSSPFLPFLNPKIQQHQMPQPQLQQLALIRGAPDA
jgi:hypothetical protein